MCRPFTSLSRPIQFWFKQTYRQPTYLLDMINNKKTKQNLFYTKCDNTTMRGKINPLTKKLNNSIKGSP